MPNYFKKNRRTFLGLAGTVAALTGLQLLRSKFGETTLTELASQAPSASQQTLSVLQGATSATSTQISVFLPRAVRLTVSATTSTGQVIRPHRVSEHSEDFSDHKFVVCFFEGLSLAEKYWLNLQNETGQLLDRRQFSTLDTKKANFKGALISCMHDRNVIEQEAMWKAVETARPEVLFFLGDSVYIDAFHDYGDIPQACDEPFFWKRYTKVRNLLYLYKMPVLIPVFATWDDHDTGSNNGNRTSPLVNEARKIFDLSFPRYDIPGVLKRTVGVASHLSIFNIDILMMDSRSFRSPAEEKTQQTHWGVDQEAWVQETLRTAKNPVWIMNGTQFFGDYRKAGESYAKVHPASFEKFLESLRTSKAPVLLTSGDIHYSEIQRIEQQLVGYPLYEITASSMHTRNKIDLFIERNGFRRKAINGKMNFVLVEVTTSGNQMQVRARSIKKYSEVAFDKTITVAKT